MYAYNKVLCMCCMPTKKLFISIHRQSSITTHFSTCPKNDSLAWIYQFSNILSAVNKAKRNIFKYKKFFFSRSILGQWISVLTLYTYFWTHIHFCPLLMAVILIKMHNLNMLIICFNNFCNLKVERACIISRQSQNQSVVSSSSINK